jgi:hypothetical protein
VKLLDDGISPEMVINHPRHQAAQEALVSLIVQLRECQNVKDGYEFQQELLRLRVAVDNDRDAYRRAMIRVRRGKNPQPGAPPAQSGLDPTSLEAWQFEYDLCERIARQYRSIGDALAWRVFGFERKYILALCRNDPPGSMARKAGLLAEIESAERAWKEGGQFAIMHDLTNCLRIGDITVFSNDGRVPPQTFEIKSNPKRRSSAQNRRIKQAWQAVLNEGPLPGDDPMERLYELDVPFKTHLDLLRTGTERAARDGIFTARVPGNRALIVTDLHGCTAQSWTETEFADRAERQYGSALGGQALDPTASGTSTPPAST